MSYTKITAHIIDQTIQLVNVPLLASGGVDVVQIQCDFCALWDDYEKTAVFSRKGGPVYHIPLVDGAVVVPHEVLAEAGHFFFGVFGVKDNTRTTEVLTLKVVQGAITIATADPKDPTPSIYDQLLAKIREEVDGQIAEAVSEYMAENPVSTAAAPVQTRYDLKDGYGYSTGVYIAADGSEKAWGTDNCKLTEYIPVTGGVSYTMYGAGYALYDGDKKFLSAVEALENAIMEFTPKQDGYVRLTIVGQDILHARFCMTSEKHKEPRDYEKLSPFYDPAIPCDVHLYGDSNSEGYGLDDPAKAWSNRLGALITSMPETVYSSHLGCFAGKAADTAYPMLYNSGYLYMTAYTDSFTVMGTEIGEVAVFIDGVEQAPMNATAIYPVELGYHRLELYGRSGNNYIQAVATNKKRSFTNHAVYGTRATSLPAVPDGNVAIVMYGTNDRALTQGAFHRLLANFVRSCDAVGAAHYVFTPIPARYDGETSEYYYQSINDVIAQLPADCINIYKDLQLAEIQHGKSLYADSLHLNEWGHKVLFAIAASKLQLAAPNSEVMDDSAEDESTSAVSGMPVVFNTEITEAVATFVADKDNNGEPFSLSHFELNISFPVVADAYQNGTFYINDGQQANCLAYYYNDTSTQHCVCIRGDLLGGTCVAERMGKNYEKGMDFGYFTKPLTSINVKTFSQQLSLPVGTKICLRGV